MTNNTAVYEYPNCVVSYFPDYPSILGIFAAETVQSSACFNTQLRTVREYSYYAFETIIYFHLIAFGVLLGCLYINCKSRLGSNSNSKHGTRIRTSMDWFTLTIFYIFGTLSLTGVFALSFEFGITKLIGFGSLLHN